MDSSVLSLGKKQVQLQDWSYIRHNSNNTQLSTARAVFDSHRTPFPERLTFGLRASPHRHGWPLWMMKSGQWVWPDDSLEKLWGRWGPSLHSCASTIPVGCRCDKIVGDLSKTCISYWPTKTCRWFSDIWIPLLIPLNQFCHTHELLYLQPGLEKSHRDHLPPSRPAAGSATCKTLEVFVQYVHEHPQWGRPHSPPPSHTPTTISDTLQKIWGWK